MVPAKGVEARNAPRVATLTTFSWVFPTFGVGDAGFRKFRCIRKRNVKNVPKRGSTP